MSFSKLGLVKFAVSGVVGLGAGKIVTNIIKANVKTPENLIDKVTMLAGAWALGGMVTAAAKKHTDEAIDDVAAFVTEQFHEIRVYQKLRKIEKKETTFEKEGLNAVDFVLNEDGHYRKLTDEEIEKRDAAPNN
jgi:hypothetical protein